MMRWLSLPMLQQLMRPLVVQLCTRAQTGRCYLEASTEAAQEADASLATMSGEQLTHQQHLSAG
jgi:hypothetical protein